MGCGCNKNKNLPRSRSLPKRNSTPMPATPSATPKRSTGKSVKTTNLRKPIRNPIPRRPSKGKKR
jgi:hypothetical protein|tara:strand:+ start:381 stop:575 length:195 start_codon:yes stop_codon:yes gene_type:complete